jgi:aromatic ring-cleaving dioxygenase
MSVGYQENKHTVINLGIDNLQVDSCFLWKLKDRSTLPAWYISFQEPTKTRMYELAMKISILNNVLEWLEFHPSRLSILKIETHLWITIDF